MNRRILAASISTCLIVISLTMPYFRYFPSGFGDRFFVKRAIPPATVARRFKHDGVRGDPVDPIVNDWGSSHVMPGDHVIQTMFVYGVKYDRISYDDQRPLWKIDDVATREVFETSSERRALYAAMTIRPLTVDEMLMAISYGADLNAAPVTNLSGDAQAQDLRAAWASQSLLQWQATHQQLAAQYATQIQQLQAAQANQIAIPATETGP